MIYTFTMRHRPFLCRRKNRVEQPSLLLHWLEGVVAGGRFTLVQLLCLGNAFKWIGQPVFGC